MDIWQKGVYERMSDFLICGPPKYAFGDKDSVVKIGFNVSEVYCIIKLIDELTVKSKPLLKLCPLKDEDE